MNPISQYYTATDHFVLVPAIMLALFGCAILLLDTWIIPNPSQRKWLLPVFVLPGLGLTGFALWRQQAFLAASGSAEITAFQGALTVDGFSLFFNWVFLIASLIVALVSYKYLEIEGEHHGEYYGLILLAQSGMFFLATGTDLVTLFIGLELMALCFYILVGFLRTDKRSNEAAMKYLILGAFSSGFLAYGFSLLYGMTGSTKLRDIASTLAMRDAWDPMVFLAMATTAVGLLFKISAVPFHMWAPDAYEGAPTTVTAYLSVASKAASFAFLLRIFMGPLAASRASWEPLLSIVAILTMTVGNLAAISQNNVKRLLAYSSISHAGYMLLGLIAGNPTGIKGVSV
ncbi:MAG: NADH-quinone oxidoreductase subunit N, partial [Candidatus Solibacter usitatus]|nr:NADH-quinone oxidoreductase subunit N [Candidatus Solibacter usitatus]